MVSRKHGQAFTLDHFSVASRPWNYLSPSSALQFDFQGRPRQVSKPYQISSAEMNTDEILKTEWRLFKRSVELCELPAGSTVHHQVGTEQPCVTQQCTKWRVIGFNINMICYTLKSIRQQISVIKFPISSTLSLHS